MYAAIGSLIRELLCRDVFNSRGGCASSSHSSLANLLFGVAHQTARRILCQVPGFLNSWIIRTKCAVVADG
jgi:hypothetical protein